MNSTPAEWKPRDFLLITLFLQFITCALVFFDVPVARQVIGFIYFTIVPGIIIVKLLKLNELDILETVLFSAGFSIAFLMLAGLFVNEFCFSFGISKPLSLTPLMVTLNSFIFAGAFVAFLRSKNIKFRKAKTLGVSPLALLLTVLPILSVLGVMWINAFGSNLILLLMTMTTALLFVVGIISKKALPPKLYPLAVLMIAISLLYSSSLISKYIVTFGSDISIEYFSFQTTENNAHWSSVLMSLGYSGLNSMLSVTILPTIYSILLNMSGTYVLKILYPLIFSLVPLALYQLWQKNLGKKRAFAAAFLLMAQGTFHSEMLGLARQMVAELFLVLLLLVILNKKMKPFNKMMCFMIFSVALVTSHYALALIFLFFISFTLISLILMKRPSRNITATMVAFFFVIMFVWYLYTSQSAVFDNIVSYGNYVYEQLDQFFNPASRGETVLRGLGLESPPTIWNTFSRAFAYLTEFFIALGFVGLIMKRVNIKLEREHFAFTVVAAAFLAALILVPGLASTMNMTRYYHILLFFLAPLCVLGAEFLIKLVSKREKELGVSILLLIVLVPYFLFQTGFVYEVTRSESWSIPLSSYRMNTYKLYCSSGYTDDWSVFAAKWMHKNAGIQHTQVYADVSSTENVLHTYGHTYAGDIFSLSNTTSVPNNGIVYLNSLNTVHKTIVTWSYVCNLDELSFLEDMNKVYTNGGGEIYRNPLGD
ncbi:MAG: DUF2206 domain-containing protein [Thermotogota bacterium]|nr:DUF2206 domain-containing protein [Thermotogota bacterium]